ncbi:MAG: MurR/RpiR family transcriptional regulator [Leifsonia sp.]|nr:MurR/RpiR family transcriptional regulator [Leifsonia sp.]
MSTVSQLLRQHLSRLPRAELDVAQVLLENYPAAGLDTVASIAQQAGVSAPTVLRLTERIGFGSFADFRDALRTELHQRSLTPLEQLPEYSADEDVLLRAPTIFRRAIEETFERLSPTDFATAVSLLSSPRKRIFATGGRFTSVLAHNLTQQLEVVRSGTRFLAVDDRTSMLPDLGPRDVVFIVDLRRYQPSTVVFGQEASRLGSKVILLTDRWLSPLTEVADAVLTCSLDAPHPLDSMVPSLAIIEALMAGVVDELGETSIPRMKRYDEAWASLGFGNNYWERFSGEPDDDQKGDA